MQLYLWGHVYNADENSKRMQGVYYLFFLKMQSYLLPKNHIFVRHPAPVGFNSFTWISLECTRGNFD